MEPGTRSSLLGELVAGAVCLLVVVALLGAIAIGVWAAVRRSAARPKIVPQPPDAVWAARPHPGEVWWAYVAYEDGSGGKVRPCLVIRTHADHVEALKITSQDKSHRRDHIEIPQTSAWDPRAEYDSFLDLSAPFWVWDDDLRRRAGTVHPWVMAQVYRSHQCGWVVPPTVVSG
ncbi:hypothetical protein GCM10010432_46850 [Catellatospora methionotrophica]